MTTKFDKHINVIDSLTGLLIQQGAVQFGKLADYLETLGINTAGNELTGERVNQPHVRTGTTLRGGSALVHARGALDELRASLSGDAALGADVSAGALSAPLYWIAVNAGLDGSVAMNKISELPAGQGLNADTLTYGDLVADGVIDPVKVTRSAVLNAASVARMVLTTETAIVEKVSQEEDDHGHGHGHHHGHSH
jgi:chaperonin GroEL